MKNTDTPNTAKLPKHQPSGVGCDDLLALPIKKSKRVNVTIDGKRTTINADQEVEARYGMGKWWREEGQYL